MRALVTGGAGFLGKAIATRIVEQGGRARSFSRGAHPELEPLGIEPIQGNLNDTQALSHAAKGCDVVFHVAARVGGWGPREEFHRTNVDGTSNVIDGCQRAAVPKLVFTRV